MELLHRYLHAVRFWLPRKRRDDILAELGDDLRSQIADRESEVGHQLDRHDVAAILARCGHPMLVGLRYRSQQPLIATELQLVYYFILRLVLLWILTPVFALIVGPIIVASSRHPILAAIEALWTYGTAMVMAGGIITLVFALITRFGDRETLTPRWNPLRLPRVRAARSETTLRFLAVMEIFASLLYSVTWIYLLSFKEGFDAGGVHIALAPVWHILYWPVLAVLLGGVPTGWASLRWPARMDIRARIRLWVDAASLTLIGILLSAGNWVILSGRRNLSEAQGWTNLNVAITLAVIGTIVILDAVREVKRLRRQNAPALVQ